ncbi:KTSC domain-containing protein [Paraburkholderia unamae]|uniref:KTSC domain-containing protein n=1 Tax=Paraburkholderia unamae TaxID=219649 RepID=A0ABX5K6W1_9BURK|nr:KTSC domain-containing protein [Paraburkholderia unamae]PVX61278.1 KTSC domain-containing protein [Paraburkholderia unamae]
MTRIIAMDSVESSQIHSIGHDAETSTLAIRFKNNAGEPTSLYHYANVDVDTFSAFKGAESIGSHFYKNIKPFKGKYPYEKIESAPAAAQEQA